MRYQLLRPFFLAGAIAAVSFAANQAMALGVKSVGSVEKAAITQVNVVFDATVDSATATTVSNYTLAGSTIQSATLITGLPAADASGNADNPPPFGRVVDNQCVILTVNGTIAGSQTLTINNVKGSDGTTLPSTTTTFTPSGYKWVDVGAPAIPSQVIAVGSDGFDVYSNGTACWNVYDEGALVYKTETGDFDTKVRIEFQDTSSRWARAGLQMRQVLNAGEPRPIQDGSATPDVDEDGTASKNMFARAHPVLCFNDAAPGNIVPANYQFESVFRDTTAGNYAGPGGGTPSYPTAWTRIQRIGSAINTFRSNDNIEWIPMSEGLEGWDGPYFVGPAFFPETGNINAAAGAGVTGRLFLTQLRFTDITIPLIKNVAPTPNGFTFQLADAPTATAVPSSLKTTWNGVVVPVTPVSNGQTPITYNVGYAGDTIFAVGTTNALTVEFKDNNNVTTIKNYSLVVNAYNVIPAAYSVGSATTRGINAVVSQIGVARGPGDGNSTANAEQQFNGGIIDPTTGEPYPNLSGTGDTITVVQVVNTLDNGTVEGNFPDGLPTPGIPGIFGDPGNFVAQYSGYIQLAKGAYRMGVNSDDGFKLTVYSGGPDSFGLKLGEFNGGRGAADSIFDLVVEADGFYPFRLLYWQGPGSGGDNGSCEWFSVNASTGEKILINDPANPAALRTFTTGSGSAFVKSFVPYPETSGILPTGQFKAVLVNGTTTIDRASITLTLDGAAVTPTIVGPTAGAFTITYTPATPYAFNSTHTGQLSYKESGKPDARNLPIRFTIVGFAPNDLPPNSFWIEAEDFNYENGKTVDAASVMPYAGGAYDGLAATLNVDYFDTDGNDSDVYRPDTAPNNVNISSETTGRFTLARPGDFTMASNYKIGWVSSGNWYNYTRTIPAGLYNVFVATSVGDANPGSARASVARVTSDPKVANQTTELIGSFVEQGTGGWSQNNLYVIRGGDGNPAVLKITGSAPTTLRLNGDGGDLDWFVLAPATGVPPILTSATPANNSSVSRQGATVTLRFTDASSPVVLSSVNVQFDGANVTTMSTITQAGDVTTVVYNPGLLEGNSQHTYRVSVKDAAGAETLVDNQFSVNILGTTGQFLIEAEDFNSNGTTQAAASTMPYTGNAYAGLPATPNVDYTTGNPDRGAGTEYRNINAPNVGINSNTGFVDRGLWTMTVNYKIGWAQAANWFDYTRTFPEGTYEVWAALSHGDGPGNATAIQGTLFQVTSDPTKPDQTTNTLGTFAGAGTGGWGNNLLFPMVDTLGQRAKVTLGGTQTLRAAIASGDYDYLMLVPATGGPVQPTMNAVFDGGNIIITYTGTLQQSPGNINGPYTAVPGANSPYTVSGAAAVGSNFYRTSN